MHTTSGHYTELAWYKIYKLYSVVRYAVITYITILHRMAIRSSNHVSQRRSLLLKVVLHNKSRVDLRSGVTRAKHPKYMTT